LVSLSCNHCDYERLAEALDRLCSEQRQRRLADTTAKQLCAWAPSRRPCRAKWYADGAAYFADVYEALEAARQEIFICDWWLTPELHLKRPDPEDRHQLMNVLQRRADAGVKIFILIYKELRFAVNTDSWYAKMMLKARCPKRNIYILRHPNHLFNADLLWTHHEKLLIVDQRLAFFGGIDLCWGRWDTQRHPLTDQGDADWPSDCRPIGDVDAFNAAFPGRAVGSGAAAGAAFTTAETSKDFADVSETLDTVDFNDTGAAWHATPDSAIVVESLDDSSSSGAGKTKRRGLMRFLSAGPRQDLGILLQQQQHQMAASMAAASSASEASSLAKRLKHCTAQDPHWPPAHSNALSLSPFLSPSGWRRYAGKPHKLRRFHTIEAHGNGSRSAGGAAEAAAAASGIVDDSAVEYQAGRQPRWHVMDDGQLQVRRLEARRVSNLWRGAIERMRIARGVRGQLRRSAAAGGDQGGFENSEDFVDSRPPELAVEARNIQLWKGLDYVNWVIKEPFNLHQPNRDLVDRNEVPRMPWHDVACAVGDNAARDLARHFIQRWNFTVRDKNLSTVRYPMLIPKAFAAVDAAAEEAAEEAAEAAAVAAAAAAAASGGGKRRWRKQRKRQTDYRLDGLDTSGRPPADNSGLSRLLPRFYNQVNILRSVGPWSAGLASEPERSIHEAMCAAIDSAECFVYIESQFFISNPTSDCAASPVRNQVAARLANRILRAHRDGRPFRVYLLLPLRPQFEEQLVEPRSMERTKKILHLTYRSLCRGPDSLLGRLQQGGIEDHTRYLAICSLRTWGRMPSGRLATELIYVHSKLLIADDRVLVLGSANINDRSLLGCRDSELAMRYEDAGPDTARAVWRAAAGADEVDIRVGSFCGSLRRCLMREHLGLLDGGDSADAAALDDPLSEKLFDRLWLGRARANSKLFESVFRCLPSDSVPDYESLAAWLKEPPLAEVDRDAAAQRLATEAPGGNLVLFPLQFLGNADLDDQLSVVPDITWH
uniref:phospholipase D n=1 Tax=Macrostomum lignano TaxID=282301 RepID=A0A1I8I247_9PLAT